MSLSDLHFSYFDFLDQWNWDMMGTLTFDHNMPLNKALAKVKKNWLKPIKEEYSNTRFAGLLLGVCPSSHPHVHLLLISDPSYPKTLPQVATPAMLEKAWPMFAKVTLSRSCTSQALAFYCVREKNLRLHEPDSWTIDFYRKSLLEKLKKTLKSQGRVSIPNATESLSKTQNPKRTKVTLATAHKGF